MAWFSKNCYLGRIFDKNDNKHIENQIQFFRYKMCVFFGTVQQNEWIHFCGISRNFRQKTVKTENWKRQQKPFVIVS